MAKSISQTKRAYLAGFLDGDGSIYVQMKPNKTYKYGFQIAPYIVLFQSRKEKKNFEKICSMIGLGYLRIRKDGILEYIIGRQEEIEEFIRIIEPYVLMKKSQVELIKKILTLKKKVKTHKDIKALAELVNTFRKLNYSKKRKIHILTP